MFRQYLLVISDTAPSGTWGNVVGPLLDETTRSLQFLFILCFKNVMANQAHLLLLISQVLYTSTIDFGAMPSTPLTLQIIILLVSYLFLSMYLRL